MKKGFNRTCIRKVISLFLCLCLGLTMAVFNVGLSPNKAEAANLDLCQYVDGFIDAGYQGEMSARAPFGGPCFSVYNNNYSSTSFYGHYYSWPYGVVTMPTNKSITVSPANHDDTYTSSINHSQDTLSPGYYKTYAGTPQTWVEAATTTRSLIVKYTFPSGQTPKLLFDCGLEFNGGNVSINDSTYEVSGYTKANAVYAAVRNKYFYFKFDTAFSGKGTWSGSTINSGSSSVSDANNKIGGWVQFNGGTTVTVRIGFSDVSVANAKMNVDAEIPSGTSFSTVKSNTYNLWNDLLNRVKVTQGGTNDERKIFYTSLYRVLTGPNTYSDVNGDYCDYDSGSGVNSVVTRNTGGSFTYYTTFATWDYIIGKWSLYCAFYPEIARDTLKSFLAFYDNHGLMPNAKYNNVPVSTMGGNYEFVYFSYAYDMGITGVDYAKAIEAMKKMATQPVYDGNYEAWPRLSEYLSKGYLPLAGYSYDTSVSTSIDYMTADFAIAKIAQLTGDTATYNTYINRANNWKLLFDPATKTIRPKNSDGTWYADYNTGYEQPGYQETDGGSITFRPSYNYQELFEQMGMSEAQSRVANMGSSFNNEPSFPMFYAGAWTDQAWRVQEMGRGILSQYNTNYTGMAIPGESDNYTMEAIYVWNALGMFPAQFGTQTMILFSPLFENIEISVPGKSTTTINAAGASQSVCYIKDCIINGVTYNKPWVNFSDINNGAILNFTLTNNKNDSQVMAWGTGVDNRPPSYTSSNPQPTPTPSPTPTPTPSPTPTPASGALDRTGWTATAFGSYSTDTPDKSLDGNTGTWWYSGAAQANGQWYQVDMKATKTFSSIKMECKTGDYPIGYQVYVSDDGTNWGSAIASGSGTEGTTTVNFSSQTKRYIKVMQTGSASNWWTILEFNVS